MAKWTSAWRRSSWRVVGPDDVQVKVISDSICMSTYKAAVEGEDHKRVPNDVAEHPTIVGHEFCGVITEVGENWKNKYKPGQGFAIQPAHFYKGSQLAPGYSYQYCGGDSQYSNIPIETLLTDNLLPYNSDTYFYGSLAEPMSCIIGTFHAMYHTKPGSYEHQMGIVEGGKMAMLASVGPMGLGAIDYALHCDRRPSLLVITDIDDARLERAQSIYTVEHAKEWALSCTMSTPPSPVATPTTCVSCPAAPAMHDVICFAPVRPVVEQAGDILGFDGCLNFFAGPPASGLHRPLWRLVISSSFANSGSVSPSLPIGEWKKNVGDHVNVGDILFTYETDKAEFECESTASGTLLEKFYEDGDEVPCLVNVCAIGNPGEDTSALKNAPGRRHSSSTRQ